MIEIKNRSELRENIMRTFVNEDVLTRQQAEIAIDLALHGTDVATDKLFDIVGTAPDEITRLSALAMSAAILRIVVEQTQAFLAMRGIEVEFRP